MLQRLPIVTTALVALLAGGCVSIDPYFRRNDGFPSFFLNEQAAVVNDVNRAPWTTYSLALATCKLHDADANGTLHSSFSCERRARGLLIDSWRALIYERPGAADPYLDDLLRVETAGFFDEYIWHYHRESHWDIPDGLAMADFAGWRRSNLTKHDPETRVLGVWQ